MHKIVDFNNAEIAKAEDWTNIGVFGRIAVDGITAANIGWPNHWAKMTVAQQSVTQIAITAGELHDQGVVYRMDDPATVDLQTYLPIIATDDRWVAIIARPATEVVNQNRPIETGEQPLVQSVPVDTSVPKYDRRYVAFVIQGGTLGPAPQDKPVVNAGDTCVAYVRLTASGGIQEIVPGETWRVKTVYEVDGRVTVLEGRLDLTIQRTSALETNFANITNRLRDIPRREVIFQMQRDIGAARRQLDLPDTARAFWYDNGLVSDAWDNTHADWHARIREGVRFAYAQITDAQLALATPADPKLTIKGNLAFPKYTETLRIEVDGSDGYKDISDQVHTVETMVQHTESGVSISYGPSFQVCENMAGWSGVSEAAQTGATFNVNGSTYVSDGLVAGSLPSLQFPGQTVDATGWNASPASEGHQSYAVQQVEYNTWTSTYWTKDVKTYGVNGSIYGQTFLMQQTGVATSIALKFTRVGSTGDINLFLCQADSTGRPDFTKVLGTATAAPGDLAEGWCKLVLDKPVLLEAGTRYAWYTVTTGNHALATVTGNKFAQGTLFWATDGAWAQGDNLTDFCFRIYTAVFEATRTVIDFAPLNCTDGMSEIQLLYAGLFPAGTNLIWEIKPVGGTVWTSILEGDATPLVGLPAQISLRATFVGTTDLAPAIKLDSTARGAAMRIATSCVGVTDDLPLGISSETVVVIQTMDNFDEGYNTAAPTIIVGGVLHAADATEVQVDYDKPSRRKLVSTFDFTGSPVTSVRVRPTFTTTQVTKACFVQDISMHAL